MIQPLESRLLMTAVIDTPPNQQINEGDYVDLFASWTDAENANYHSAIIDWGDGSSPEQAYVDDWGGSGYVYAWHTYSNHGVYTVSLDVLDDDGGTGSTSFTTTVNRVAPQPYISGPDTAITGSPYTLSLETYGSSDEIDHWTIDWGDGSTPEEVDGNPSSVDHIYTSAPHTYEITASVTDPYGTYDTYYGVTVTTAQFGRPTELKATTVSGHRVDLSWKDNAASEGNFRLELSTNGGSSWYEFATVSANQTSYAVTGLQPGLPYQFRVRAQHPSGSFSGYTEVVSSPTLGVSAPGNLQASIVSETRVRLNWEDRSEDEGNFRLQLSTDNGTNWSEFATVSANQTNYIVSGLLAGVPYRFRALTQDPGGTYSAPSNVATAITMFTAPSTLTAAPVSGTQINLVWQDNTHEEGNFRVEISGDGGTSWNELATVSANQTSYVAGGLVRGTNYRFRVRAQHSNGQYSSYSNIATVSTPVFTQPTELSATIVSGTRVDLKWVDNTDDEGNFRVEISSNGGSSWNEFATVSANQTIYPVANLDPAITYSFRVRSQHSNSQFSAYSNVVTAVTMPFSAPSGLTARILYGTDVELKWNDNTDDEANFRLEVTSNGGASWSEFATVSANQSSYVVSNLYPGTTYGFRVRAQHPSGSFSPYSAPISIVSPPVAIPGGFTATVLSGTSIELRWADQSDNEANFRLEGSSDGGTTWGEFATVSANQTSYVVAGLTAGNSYSFRARTQHLSGAFSNYSQTVSTTTLAMATPATLTAHVVSGNRIDLSWTDNSEEEGNIRVEYSADGGSTWGEYATVGSNQSSCSVTGLTSGTTYKFRIRAQHPSSVYSAFSNTVSATAAGIGAPDDLYATNAGSGSIALAWRDNSPAETGYDIQKRIVGQSSFTTAGTASANATGYTVTGLDDELEYEFRVRSTDGTTTSSWSEIARIGSSPSAAPTSLSAATVSGSQINLSWDDNSTNEYTFVVERSDDGGDTWTSHTSVGASRTSYAATGLQPGTSYKFRVRAQHGTGAYSGYSNTVTVSTRSLQTPSNLTAEVVSGSRIDLSWDDNSDNEYLFSLERSTDNGTTWQGFGYVWANQTSVAVTDLLPGRTYQFRIRLQHTNNTYSDYSNIATESTLAFSAPGSLTANVVSNSRIDLFWDDTTDSEYIIRLERSLDGGTTWSGFGYVWANQTSVSVTDLLPGVTYQFRTRVQHVTGFYSEYSNIAVATATFDAPSQLTATVISGSRIDLNWQDNVDNEYLYRLERSVDGGSSWSGFGYVWANQTSTSVTDLTPGVTYQFRVRAEHATGGHSAYSNVVTAQAVPFAAPSNLTLGADVQDTVQLSWKDNANNEYLYRIEYSTDEGTSWQGYGYVWDNQTSISVAGLRPNTTYQFRVRGQHVNGSYSAYSNTVTLERGFAVATQVVATFIGSTRVNLKWNDNADNEYLYRVEYSSDSGSTWQGYGYVWANQSSCAISGLLPGHAYQFRIRAQHETGGYAAYSVPLSLTTVTFERPTALTVARVSGTTAELSWADNTDDEYLIRVERSTDGGSNWQGSGYVWSSQTSFVVGDLNEGTNYEFRIRAQLSDGVYSAYSYAGTPTPTLSKPTGLTVAWSGQSSHLSWSDNSNNESGFQVDRQDSSGVWTRIANVGAGITAVNDFNVPEGTYTYRVRACYGTYLFSDYTVSSEYIMAGSLFAAKIDIDIDGASDLNEGGTYTLALNPENVVPLGWTVDWGDGSITNVEGSPSSVTHQYVDGDSTYTIKAYARVTAPEMLDALYGTHGVTSTDTGVSVGSVAKVVMQADGKAVVAGGPQVRLVRYLTDGSLDTSFGTAGMVVRSGLDSVVSIDIQADGKIVALGGPDFKLVRFNSSGMIDPGFGINGWASAGFGSSFVPVDLKVLNSGKIVVVGNHDSRIVLARFNANGTLDTTFGEQGMAITDHVYGNEEARSLVIAPHGKIIVVGRGIGSSSGYDVLLRRFNASGTLDASCPLVLTDFGNSDEAAEAVTVQSDGKMLLTGRTGAGGSANLVVARYEWTGALDSSFASNGKFVLDAGGFAANVGYDIKVLNDGRIVVVGGMNSDFGVLRLLKNGTPDPSMSWNGAITTNFGGDSDAGRSAVVDSEGNLIVAGVAGNAGATDFAIARYLIRLEDSQVVTVHNVAPTLQISGVDNIPIYQEYTLSLQVSDPAGNHDSINHWNINWGDGSDPDQDGIIGQFVAGDATVVSHGFASTGPFTISATATDEDGTFNAASVVTLTVTSEFEAQWTLDDKVGLIAKDTEGPNDAALINGPTWTKGVIGGGLNMDWSNDRLDNVSLEGTPTSFSVSFWLNPNQVPTSPTEYSHFITESTGWGKFRFFVGQNGKAFVGTDEAHRIDLPVGIVEVGRWQHFEFTFSSNGDGATGTGTFYKNGMTQTGWSNSVMLLPAEWRGFSIIKGAGKVDDVRISQTAESAVQIENAYNKIRDSISSIETIGDVYNKVKYEVYAGSMKSVIGVAETGRGNEWDTAALLKKKLEDSGYNTRFVYGRVRARTSDVQEWLGVKKPEQALALLALQARGVFDVPIQSGEYLEFNHVWLETDYGAATGSFGTTIDPSWKYRNYQPGVVDLLEDVKFVLGEEDNKGGLLRAKSTAYDYYAGQLQDYLATQGKGLADASYDGPIIQLSLSQQLNRSPYSVLPNQQLTKTSTMPTGVQHKVTVHVVHGEDFTPEQTVAVSTIGQGLITTEFSNGTLNLHIETEGSPINESLTGLSATDEITIYVNHEDPHLVTGGDPYHATTYTRQAGDSIAIGLNAGQISDQGIARQEAELAAIAVRKEEGEAFSSTDGAARNQYVRQIIALAQLKYFRAMEAQRQTLADWTGFIPVRKTVESGMMTGSNGIREVFSLDTNLQYPILPKRLRTDNKGIGSNTEFVAISDNFNSQSKAAIRALTDVNSSSLESDIIETFMNAQAVSTLEGFQWLKQEYNVDWLVTLGPANTQAQVNSALALLTNHERSEIWKRIHDHGYTLQVSKYRAELGTWIGAVWIEEKTIGTENGIDIVDRGFVTLKDGNNTYPDRGGDSEEDANKAEVDPTPVDPWDAFSAPVNTANGNAQRNEVDFTLPGVGLPIQFARHYDSFFDERQADDGMQAVDRGLGVGWMYTFGDYLDLGESTGPVDSLYWGTPEGLRLNFRWDHFNDDTPKTLINPAGYYGVAQFVGLEFNGGDSEYQLFAFSNVDGTQHVFRRKLGERYGYLRSITDRNGNTLQMARDDSEVHHRLTGVFRNNVEVMHFEYWSASDQGDFKGDANSIKSVTDVVGGRTWTYEYANFKDEDQTPTRYYLKRVRGPKPPLVSDSVNTTYSYFGEDEGSRENSPRLIGSLRSIVDGRNGAMRSYNYYPNRRVMSVVDTVTSDKTRAQSFSYDIYHRTAASRDYNGNNLLTKYSDDFQVIETVAADSSRSNFVYGGLDNVGVYINGAFKLDMDGDGAYTSEVDRAFNFGQTGDLPIGGDWTGDGYDKIGVYRPSTGMFILDSNGSFSWDIGDTSFEFGGINLSTLPVIGDWNRDGIDDVGTFLNGTFKLDSNGDRLLSETGEEPFTYGTSGDRPVAGDWDGNGTIEIGVYRPSTAGFYLDQNDDHMLSNDGFISMPDSQYYSYPAVGHWSRDNRTDVGSYAKGDDGIEGFYLDGSSDNHIWSVSPGDAHKTADTKLNWNNVATGSEIPVIGNWNRDGSRAILITQRDAIGRRTRMWQNNEGQVVKQIAPDGLVTESAFAAAFDPASLNPTFNGVLEIHVLGRNGLDGRVTSFRYDQNGNLVTTRDAIGQMSVMSYDSNGRLLTLTKPKGVSGSSIDAAVVSDSLYTTTYTYKTISATTGILPTSLVESEKHGNTGSPLSQIDRGYDQRGNLVTVTNGKPGEVQQTTHYEPDILGRVIETTAELDGGTNLTTYTSYENGFVKTTTDAAGHVTRTDYDLLGRPILSRYEADGARVQTKYDDKGNVIETTNELGHATLYFYDNRNRLIQRIYADGTTSLIRYDGAGRVVATTDALGRTSTVEFDARDRKITETLPDTESGQQNGGPKNQYVYNDLGLVKQIFPSESNQPERSTQFTLDKMGRAIVTLGPDGAVSSIKYDQNGNILLSKSYGETGRTVVPTESQLDGVADPRVTSFEYDGLDRKVQETSPDPDGAGLQSSPVTKYEYDSIGNLVAQRDANENWTVSIYDSLGRVVGAGKSEREGSVSVSGGASTITLMGHGLKSGDRVLIRAPRSATTKFGKVLTATVVDGDHFTVPSFGFAGGDALISVQATSTAYDAAGNVASTTDPRGFVSTYEYDLHSRLHKTIAPGAGNPTTTVNYDLAGNRINEIDALGNRMVYQYDSRNRLIFQQGADADGNPLTHDSPKQSFTYDATGHRLSTTDALGRTTLAAYDALGRSVATGVAPRNATFKLVDDHVEITLSAHSLQVDDRVVIAGTGTKAFDGFFTVSSIIDSSHFTVQYNASNATPLAEVSGKVSSTVRSTVYGANGLPSKTIDELGRVTEFEYDLAGRKTREILPDPDGDAGSLDNPEISYSYDVFGNLLSTTDARSYTTDYTYDKLNRKRSQILPDADQNLELSTNGPLGRPTTTYTYDSVGNVKTVTDPAGRTATTLYDSMNRPVVSATGGRQGSVSQNDGSLSVSLTKHGFQVGDRILLSGSLESGLQNLYIVNSISDPDHFSITTPSGLSLSSSVSATVSSGVKTFAYDASGNVESTADGLGYVTRFEYDERNRKTAEIKAAADGSANPGPRTSFTYDAVGNLKTITDAVGNASTNPALYTTTYNYDHLNRRIEEIGADGDGNAATNDRPVNRYRYDLVGNVISVTNPLALVSTTEFDQLNRKIAARTSTRSVLSIIANGSTAKVTSVSHGFVTGEHVVIDGANQSDFNGVFAIKVLTPDTFEYTMKQSPASSNATGTIRVSGSVSKFSYDRVGNVVSTTDSYGNSISSFYDALNRKTVELLADPDPSNGTTEDAPQTVFTYDPSGNVLSVTDSRRGRITFYEYDALNRKVKEILPDPDTSVSGDLVITTSRYDIAGNLVSVTDPRGFVSSSVFDSQNRVIAAGRVEREGTLAVASGQSLATISLTDHGFAIGDRVIIRETGSSQLDGVYSIASVGAGGDTFTIALASASSGFTGTGLVAGFAVSSVYDGNGRVVSTTDARGNTVRTEYDALNRKTADILPATEFTPSSITSYKYDANGNITQIIDPIGNLSSDPNVQLAHATIYAYDPLNRKRTETLPDPDGSAGSLISPVTSWNYNLAGQLISVVDPRTHATQISYDSMGRKRKEILPDPDGLTSTANDSPTTTWSYDPNGNLMWVTSPRGNVPGANPFSAKPVNFTTFYEYDRLNRKVQETQPDSDGVSSTTGDQPKTRYEYDTSGNLTSVIDPLGNVPGANAAAHKTTYMYDGLNRKVLEFLPGVDAGTAITRYGYDQAGNLVWSIDAIGNQELGNSPTQSEIMDLVTGHHHATRSFYDPLNRKVADVGPLKSDSASIDEAPVSTTGYDANGNVIWSTGPLGNTYSTTNFNAPQKGTQYTATSTFDELNRVVKQTSADPDGAGSQKAATTRFGYDVKGNLVWTLDPLGNELLGDNPSTTTILTKVAQNWHTSTTAYDALHRKISEKAADPDHSVATTSAATRPPESKYEYDSIGNLTKRIDPDGNETTYTYDFLNRLSLEKSHTDTYGDVYRGMMYTVDGSILAKTDRNGRQIVFVYDQLGRVTTEQWRDEDNQTIETIATQYDVAGRTTWISDGYSARSYTYDALGQLISTNNVGTPNQPWQAWDYTYDVAGRRLTESSSISGNADLVNAYTYFDNGLLDSLTQSAPSVNSVKAEFKYLRDGSLEEMTRSGGSSGSSLIRTLYTFDQMSRLQSMLHRTSSGSTTLAAYDFEYNTASWLTKLTTSADGSSTYEYDDNGQLTNADHSSQSDESYSYDANGNRTNAGYSTASDNRLTTDGTYTYEYDKEGNRTKRTGSGTITEYAYDHHNRLREVVTKTSGGTITKKVQYVYDALGNRLAKRIDSNGDNTFDQTERFGYDDGGKLSHTFSETGTIQSRFLQGPAADSPIAESNATSNTVTWMLVDHQGTVRDTVNSTSGGSLSSTRHVVFDAFGNVTGSNSVLRFGYTGQEQDLETGLLYMNTRYYDPKVGRFMSQDTIGYQAGDSNLYRYVGNGTMHRQDPQGQSWLSEALHDVGDFFEDVWEGFEKGWRHFWKGVGSSVLDATGWLLEKSGIGSFGIDLGFANFSFSAGGGHSKFSFGLLGGQVEFDKHGDEIDTEIGAHLGFGIIGAASIAGDYMDGRYSIGGTYGPMSAGITYDQRGSWSGNLGVNLLSGKSGANSFRGGYGLGFGEDGVSGSFSAGISAPGLGKAGRDIIDGDTLLSGLDRATSNLSTVFGGGAGSSSQGSTSLLHVDFTNGVVGGLVTDLFRGDYGSGQYQESKAKSAAFYAVQDATRPLTLAEQAFAKPNDDGIFRYGGIASPYSSNSVSLGGLYGSDFVNTYSSTSIIGEEFYQSEDLGLYLPSPGQEIEGWRERNRQIANAEAERAGRLSNISADEREAIAFAKESVNSQSDWGERQTALEFTAFNRGNDDWKIFNGITAGLSAATWGLIDDSHVGGWANGFRNAGSFVRDVGIGVIPFGGEAYFGARGVWNTIQGDLAGGMLDIAGAGLSLAGTIGGRVAAAERNLALSGSVEGVGATYQRAGNFGQPYYPPGYAQKYGPMVDIEGMNISAARNTSLAIGREGAVSSGPTVGGRWYENFASKYGAENVAWTSGSGRTISWPDELPIPASSQMYRVRPPTRSSTFSSELATVIPRPSADAIAHHWQPLGLNGLDDGVINGSWEFNPWHQRGHDVINRQVNHLEFGTEIRILPP